MTWTQPYHSTPSQHTKFPGWVPLEAAEKKPVAHATAAHNTIIPVRDILPLHFFLGTSRVGEVLQCFQVEGSCPLETCSQWKPSLDSLELPVTHNVQQREEVIRRQHGRSSSWKAKHDIPETFWCGIFMEMVARKWSSSAKHAILEVEWTFSQVIWKGHTKLQPPVHRRPSERPRK